jgi:hypothetical protein
MSGLRFVICLSLASIAGLMYAGTAAALGGSTPVTTPVTAGVTATTATVVASGSVDAGQTRLDATVAVSTAESEPGSSSPAPASVSSTVEVAVGAAGGGVSTEARVASSADALPTASKSPVRHTRVDVAKSRPANRVARHVRRAAKPTRSDARAARPTARPLRLRSESQPAKRVAAASSGGTVISDDWHVPGSAGAASGGGSGVAVSAILVVFIFLAAPWCGRRLRRAAELARPPALLSALERPG